VRGVSEAVSRIGPEAAGQRASVPGRGAPSITEAVLPQLINAIAALPRAIVLVLEDYHRLGDGEVHEKLAVLLDRGPANLRVVLSTRTDPDRPAVRARASAGEPRARRAQRRATSASAPWKPPRC
jgi:LuxR family transcriptional regulator, maltose regulon positive regulatory protein